jgi:pilus assembly protein FimV
MEEKTMSANSSSHDDSLDLDSLGLTPTKAKSKAVESDFEKELEALFAEELASSDEKPASAPPVGGPELEEDALLLDDLVADAPEAQGSGPAEDEDDILDLSAFATGGEMDLTPPEETAGGKDGDIDLSGLDELISGLGDKKPAPAAAPMAEPEPLEPAPLDSTDMADLLETLDVPKAAAKPAVEPEAGPEEELLELSLGDLLEEAPLLDESLEPKAASEQTIELGDAADAVLDLTLPDISDPAPGRDLVAEAEQADLGGDLNLSLPDLGDDTAPVEGMDQILDSGDLDMSGLMEGIEPSAGEPAPELSLDPQDLLDQIAEPAAASALARPVAFTPEPEPPAPEVSLPLADAALWAVTAEPAAAPAAEAAAAPAQPAAASEALAGLEQRLAELATQVTGSSVAVVRLEGQLAEREKAFADLEQRLLDAQEEAQALRDELNALRTQLEGSLDAQVAEAKQAAHAAAEKAETLEKASAGTGERLALLEDRQTQLDREIFAEISRAVPREAARVIREEIAHLAASMRDE